MGDARWSTWRDATDRALYGPAGFYRRSPGVAARHFRTSSAASTHFAGAVARLVEAVDGALGSPWRVHFVEVAASGGRLAVAVREHLKANAPSVAARLVTTCVELGPRPPDLPTQIEWVGSVADVGNLVGVVFANEWLDNVPVDVVEMTEGGPRLVEVDTTGEERLGAVPPDDDAGWLAEWWPGEDPGDRAEVGLPRDEQWAAVVGHLQRGLAVAVDYGHVRAQRDAGVYPAGTLTGYRDGRQVAPVPDGTCDITAHVALDAVAAAGERAGANASLLTDQRTALRALGVSGATPPRDLAAADPGAYLAALRSTGEQVELISRGGLGDFGWLVQAVGVEIPHPLRALPDMRAP